MNFHEIWESDRALAEAALAQYTAYDEALGQYAVVQAMRYSLLGGGKRIRAVLALETCAALGGEKALALPAACALEMIHAYSLVHDDLPCMDDDDMRRGKPSCHRQFGEALAVLAGDGLQTLAFETVTGPQTVAMLGEGRALALVAVLARSAGVTGMLGGQTIDVCSEGKDLTPQQHSEMVAMKTGALLTASVHCGCIAAGADEIRCAQLLRCAGQIGLAFQITDDLLDVVGRPELLGKPTGSDQRAQKVTFVTVLGQEEAKQRAQQLYTQARGVLCSLFGEESFLPQLVDFLAERAY